MKILPNNIIELFYEYYVSIGEWYKASQTDFPSMGTDFMGLFRKNVKLWNSSGI